mmetsp:Transcript_7775/g.15431  ORF Transcript_7775/g.15431 Transcript_7775/m.15431 type:complete len:99 (+) Transcript_7775:390-686(+)
MRWIYATLRLLFQSWTEVVARTWYLIVLDSASVPKCRNTLDLYVYSGYFLTVSNKAFNIKASSPIVTEFVLLRNDNSRAEQGIKHGAFASIDLECTYL